MANKNNSTKSPMLPEEWIIAILLIVMVLMVAAQVLSRYIFHTSLSHTEELVRYFFVWATFLGIAAAANRKKHLSIAFASGIIPERYMKWVKKVAGLCALLFAGVIMYYGVRVVVLQIQTQQKTAALGMPMWIIGLAVPVCSAVLIVRIFMSRK
ncbi:TRAP transporter small permease [Candidatus Omnitrophota bacterium]